MEMKELKISLFFMAGKLNIVECDLGKGTTGAYLSTRLPIQPESGSSEHLGGNLPLFHLKAG